MKVTKNELMCTLMTVCLILGLQFHHKPAGGDTLLICGSETTEHQLCSSPSATLSTLGLCEYGRFLYTWSMIFSFTWTETQRDARARANCNTAAVSPIAGWQRRRHSGHTHLSDGVAVQHLHRRHVGPLAMHQHLQRLTSQTHAEFSN